MGNAEEPSTSSGGDKHFDEKVRQVSYMMDHQLKLQRSFLEFLTKQREKSKVDELARDAQEREDRIRRQEKDREHEIRLIEMIAETQNKALHSIMNFFEK